MTMKYHRSNLLDSGDKVLASSLSVPMTFILAVIIKVKGSLQHRVHGEPTLFKG